MEEQSPPGNLPREKSTNKIKETQPNDRTEDVLTEVKIDEKPLNQKENDNQLTKEAKIPLRTKSACRIPIKTTNIIDGRQDKPKVETVSIQDLNAAEAVGTTEQYTTCSFNKNKYTMKEKITPQNSNPIMVDEDPKERYTYAKGDAEDQMVKMAGRELAW